MTALLLGLVYLSTSDRPQYRLHVAATAATAGTRAISYWLLLPCHCDGWFDDDCSCPVLGLVMLSCYVLLMSLWLLLSTKQWLPACVKAASTNHLFSIPGQSYHIHEFGLPPTHMIAKVSTSSRYLFIRPSRSLQAIIPGLLTLAWPVPHSSLLLWHCAAL